MRQLRASVTALAAQGEMQSLYRGPVENEGDDHDRRGGVEPGHCASVAADDGDILRPTASAGDVQAGKARGKVADRGVRRRWIS